MSQSIPATTTLDEVLSQPGAWDLVSSGYESDMLPILEAFSQDAIELARVGLADRVLDVATGPGTLALLLAERAARVDAVDFSAAMLQRLAKRIARDGTKGIYIHRMDGQALSFPDREFDVAFSMFGLMLFPDRGRGLAEIHRVLVPGGRCAISSWAPIEHSSLMGTILRALGAAMGGPEPQPPEPSGLQDRDVFVKEMETAGFQDVTIHTVSHGTSVTDADSFWESIVRGTAPLALMKQGLSPEQWREKSRIATDYLTRSLPALPAELRSQAFIATGVRT